VCDGSACLVLSHCVVGYGMAVSVWGGAWSRRLSSSSLPLLFLFLLFVLVFGVVRAQPCEHARYPRTPLCLTCCLLCLSCLLFSVPRLSSCPAFPVIVEWRGGAPCVGVPSWHDCDG